MSLSKIKRFAKRNGLLFYTKITLLGGEVVSRQSHSKMKVWSYIQANKNKFEVIYISVTYKPGIYNDGEYRQDQYNEFLNAWQSFTDEGLIKEALQY